MEELRQVVIDGTMGYTFIQLAVAIVISLFGMAFVMIALYNYKKKANSTMYYNDTIIAFKVGYIHKHAAEANITLMPPPKSDLMATLEDEVSKDMHST